MRIGSLAEAAGTTPRAVRHYHRLGLLDEPRRLPNGYREYTIDDVVRVMRIRWLADCGIPLGAVAAALDGSAKDETDVVADLQALLAGIESERKVLARKHERLSALLQDALADRPLTAIPHEAADALRTLIDASSEHERAGLERERDLIEVMVLSGTVPASFFQMVTATFVDADRRAEYLSLLRRFGMLEGRDPNTPESDIDCLATELASFVDLDSIAPPSPDTRAGFGPDETGPLSIADILPDPAQRTVVVRATAHVLGRDGLPSGGPQ